MPVNPRAPTKAEAKILAALARHGEALRSDGGVYRAGGLVIAFVPQMVTLEAKGHVAIDHVGGSAFARLRSGHASRAEP